MEISKVKICCWNDPLLLSYRSWASLFGSATLGTTSSFGVCSNLENHWAESYSSLWDAWRICFHGYRHCTRDSHHWPEGPTHLGAESTGEKDSLFFFTLYLKWLIISWVKYSVLVINCLHVPQLYHFLIVPQTVSVQLELVCVNIVFLCGFFPPSVLCQCGSKTLLISCLANFGVVPVYCWLRNC